MQNEKDFIRDFTAYMKKTAQLDTEHAEPGIRNLDWPSDELAAFNLHISIQDTQINHNRITKH
jgi:hypothetical protein